MDVNIWMEFLQGMLKPLAATAVVLVAVLLSFFQHLGLEKEMVYAIFRAFLQLSIIGFVLQFIFTQRNSVWIVFAYLFMVVCFSQLLFSVPAHMYFVCSVFRIFS